MHPRDQIVRFEAFDKAITDMMALLEQLELSPKSGSTIAQQHSNAFAALYHSVYKDLRSSVSRADEFRNGASLAGLGDLSKKILDAAATSGGLEIITPHLRNMIAGNAQMTDPSLSIDAAANKHSELYVAALAMNSGFSVDLEDPEASADGTNPDLLLDDSTGSWSIAVKALHSASAQSNFDNLEKAASQIAAAGRPGIIFVNAKNIVNHEGLQSASPYSSVQLATGAVIGELNKIAQRLRTQIVQEDWDRAFAAGNASRVIALMAQITVSVDFTSGPMFLPVKAIKVLYGLPLAEDGTKLTSGDREALCVLERLNEQLQKNP